MANLKSVLRWSWLSLSVWLLGSTVSAAPVSPELQREFDASIKPFLQTHCYECHDERKARAGFRIDLLGTDFLAGKTADGWKEVIDKLNLGQMPPKKKARPDAKEAFAVVEWVNRELRNADKAAKNAGGRIPMRRLNRTEYANSVRDLFELDENFARRIEDELPMDGKVDGFDRGGVALFVDEAQLSRYLEVADIVLKEGVFLPQPKVVNLDWKMARDVKVEANPVEKIQDGNGVTGVNRTVPRGPTFWEMKNGGIEYISGNELYRPPGYKQVHYNGYWLQQYLKQDGWYRVRVRAGAFAGTGKFALPEVKMLFEYCIGSPIAASQSVVIDAPMDAPKEYEMLVYLRYGSADINHKWNIGWNVTYGSKGPIIVDPSYWDPRVKPVNIAGAIQQAIDRKYPASRIEKLRKDLAEAYADANKVAREFQGPMNIYNPMHDLKQIPRLWVDWITLEGPIMEWPTKGYKQWLSAGEQRTDDGYIREILTRFIPRAYRRPVTAEEIDVVVDYTLKTRDKYKLSTADTVREGMKAVLCSPGFLYIQEPTEQTQPRQLNDYELASRMSYLIWSTMPDEQLLDLAAKNRLHEPQVRQGQVKRMIADPKSAEFVRGFAGQWLKVREFDGVIPDHYQYRDYDEDLRASGKREPLEFFNEVLRSDLSVLSFLDSDFIVVNDRLAKHYGIEGIKGSEFRKVPVDPEHRRGGLLGMAGLLTYLSDGQRTLPVRRGAYLLDTLWNAPPPPPPPNAGDLPASKGKPKTVRARLAEHRESPNCASCHNKIDPFGLALENFDAIGAWRDRQNGEGMRGDKYAPPLDVSGQLPDGPAFTTFAEFKAGLMTEKQRFLRGFTEKMLTYALGRPVGYTDHETIEEICNAMEKDGYKIQTMIQAIVASRVFQTK